MTRIRLPNGFEVRASAIDGRTEVDDWRDFGLYLDHAWTPTWCADTIEWPDFGIPSAPETAIGQIIDAFNRITGGEKVEVGCLGGLGRTGTVLACFAVLSGLEAEDAIKWVRSEYDQRAIETPEQERWVSWFAGQQ